MRRPEVRRLTFSMFNMSSTAQGDLGTAWAGPGMTGDSPPTRSTGVTDTATATWQSWSLASIDDDAKQLKNVGWEKGG